MRLSNPPPAHALAEIARGPLPEGVAELTTRLRRQHDEYERAAQSWTAEASEQKREARKAREGTLREIQDLLVSRGQGERSAHIDRLPFAHKLAVLEAWVEAAGGQAPTSPQPSAVEPVPSARETSLAAALPSAPPPVDESSVGPAAPALAPPSLPPELPLVSAAPRSPLPQFSLASSPPPAPQPRPARTLMLRIGVGLVAAAIAVAAWLGGHRVPASPSHGTPLGARAEESPFSAADAASSTEPGSGATPTQADTPSAPSTRRPAPAVVHPSRLRPTRSPTPPAAHAPRPQPGTE